MLGFIDKLYHKKISSKGLGVFRICFGFILLLEVNRIFRYKELYYDVIPFVTSISFNYSLVLLIWQICLIAIILGVFTRFFAVVNYLIGYVLINDYGVYEYHMDYVYLGICFLLIFIPTENSFSIDASFRSKLKPFKSSKKTSVLSYYSIIFIGIALVYFGSIFFKVRSQAWLSGLGIWLPCSLPQVAITNNQWILNQEYLIKLIGYLALCFEFIFPFVFFVKKWRFLLCIFGVFMHVGIAIVFPIPYFAFGYVAMYLLLIPVSFWGKLELKMKSVFKLKNKDTVYKRNGFLKLFKYYFSVIDLSFSGFINIKLIKYAFIAICFLQINAAVNMANKSLIRKLNEHVLYSENLTSIIKSSVKSTRHFSQELLGITGHGVFVDGHYIGFDKIFTLKYKNEFLPLYDEVGMPGTYLKSGIWANYNFRVNKPFVLRGDFGKLNLKKGLSRYAAFWAHENNVDISNSEFEILMKPIEAQFTWKKDLLEDNLKKPWVNVGTINWLNKKATVHLNVNKQIKSN